MDAVILFSHGSLLCGAGEALNAHAARLRERGVAPIVEVGYLNYSEPPFAATVEQVVRRGAKRIVVAPYFLAPGKFVKTDLPQVIAVARSAHPEVSFVVADAIGYDERLADALIASAHSAVGPSQWREDLKRAAASCRSNPECPLYGTPDCPGAGGGGQGSEVSTEGEKGRRGEGEQFQIENRKSDSAFILHPSALLVMVHGSPRPTANEEMFRVVEVVKRRGVFPIVEVGFLECNAPDIPSAIDACVEQGAATVIAVPYFLHTGTHVADDLPSLLEAGRERHPTVRFRLGDYLGRTEKLTDIMEDRICARLIQQD